MRKTQLQIELEKEIEMYELAIEVLTKMPEFDEEFMGTTICQSPIKTLENILSTLHYQLHKTNTQ